MEITLAEIKEKTSPILNEYGIMYAGVFGSYARGDARPDSDVDILVRFNRDKKHFSLWDLVGFQRKLSERLGRDVDVVSEDAIVSYFKDYIYRDLKTIYTSHE